MKKIKIKINGVEIACFPGTTVMQAASENGLELPNLCFHPDLTVKANCRVCVVEITGRSELITACSTKIEAGMEIITDSERVKRSRNLNIELIFTEHIEKCPTCVWRMNCKILDLADRYKIEITKFSARKAKRKVYKFANAVEIDGRQCIDCRNCLEVCGNLQKISYLGLRGRGLNQEIAPVNKKNFLPFIKNGNKADCIYCGQCAAHCPVGAAREQVNWRSVARALNSQSKVMVAQFPASVRAALGEEFGLAHAKITSAQIAAALRLLGFKYVFDADFGVDVAAIIEIEALLKKIKSGGRRTRFTSSCPAWVKYVEFYRPDLKPDLSAGRSPHLESAGLIKTYWAEKLKIDRRKIALVSIMPCTARKFEAGRADLKIGGRPAVDYVITARELAWLIKTNRIDFAELEPIAADNVLGASSGAAALCGTSGGLMESVLKTVEHLLAAGREPLDALKRAELKNENGRTGIKEAEIELAGKKLKIAVLSGIGNIKPLLTRALDYDYIEVMACPDGCAGGGGQPRPATAAIRKKRLAALYKISGHNKIRSAYENKEAVRALAWLKGKGKLGDDVMYVKR